MTMYEDPPRKYRLIAAVRRDGLWPTSEGDVPGTLRVRLMALQEVLCRLPPAPYDQLCARPPLIQWHVDDRRRLGQVRPQQVRDGETSGGVNASVVELGESLEHASWPIVVTVVAHELAHVVLEHAPAADPPAHDQQEIESWNALRQWGFAAEADVAEFLLCHNPFVMA